MAADGPEARLVKVAPLQRRSYQLPATRLTLQIKKSSERQCGPGTNGPVLFAFCLSTGHRPQPVPVERRTSNVEKKCTRVETTSYQWGPHLLRYPHGETDSREWLPDGVFLVHPTECKVMSPSFPVSADVRRGAWPGRILTTGLSRGRPAEWAVQKVHGPTLFRWTVWAADTPHKAERPF